MIKPTSKFFLKMDAVSGYHQMFLDDDSSFLTTFLLPQGKFRYLRGPMGLYPTSDEWCLRSDRVIEGIPGTCKIVDDIDTWASTASPSAPTTGHSRGSSRSPCPRSTTPASSGCG